MNSQSVTLTMTENQHASLMTHLFPHDGFEAVAIAVCGRASCDGLHRLLVKDLTLIPYEICKVRQPDQVKWPTDILVPILQNANKFGLGVIKIHGHRNYNQFSCVDDDSDRQLFPSIYSWTESELPHASVILTYDGGAFGRVVTDDGTFHTLRSINIVGDDIKFLRSNEPNTASIPEHATRVAQTFGEGTYERLSKLRIGIVGCSGTGSPIIEQLARNCVGSLVIVDPDHVELKNLNRIYNATFEDAVNCVNKVDVAKRAIMSMGLGTEVRAHPKSLFDRNVIKDITACDIVFGCVDSIDGRYLLNKISSFYLIPYFDLGVRIDADGFGGVDQVCGTVHYIKPGGSSLISRNLFTLEQVRSSSLQRTDPTHYHQLLEEGYIRGVNEDRPAVIQLNSMIASIAVNELLARLHPFRSDPNVDFAINRISLTHGLFDHEPDGTPCTIFSRHLGRGDVEPPLDWTELSIQRD